MLDSIFGIKIGMTQIFDEKGVVTPVTAVNVDHWFVTQVKTKENDGYCAVQLGLLKKKYRNKIKIIKNLNKRNKNHNVMNNKYTFNIMLVRMKMMIFRICF